MAERSAGSRFENLVAPEKIGIRAVGSRPASREDEVRTGKGPAGSLYHARTLGTVRSGDLRAPRGAGFPGTIDDFHITCYHSNNPYPGSEYQPWHRDIHLITICPALISASSSPWWVHEVMQYLADPRRNPRRAARGDFPPAHRLNRTFWVQDPPFTGARRTNRPGGAGHLLFESVVPHVHDRVTEAEYGKLSPRQGIAVTQQDRGGVIRTGLPLKNRSFPCCPAARSNISIPSVSSSFAGPSRRRKLKR